MCIAETENRDYEVTYKKYKSAQEDETDTINIVLKEYVESYNDELIHDPKKSELYIYKADFLKGIIQEVFGERAFISTDNLDTLIDDIDEDVEEILEEYEGYTNNDDDE